ncbi:hypothetical protein SKAU_G00140520 [Synaphobranchus kaupii]|uniref:Uncharacterized protein n=1 Tax=Synaphobranchus kaupii TaxID=118154 RepID=A0A9Q1FSR5_SYNKA|nr:hypothetical protein SKAU_G00140520 [Synaphobranchus kaupii]
MTQKIKLERVLCSGLTSWDQKKTSSLDDRGDKVPAGERYFTQEPLLVLDPVGLQPPNGSQKCVRIQSTNTPQSPQFKTVRGSNSVVASVCGTMTTIPLVQYHILFYNHFPNFLKHNRKVQDYFPFDHCM